MFLSSHYLFFPHLSFIIQWKKQKKLTTSRAALRSQPPAKKKKKRKSAGFSSTEVMPTTNIISEGFIEKEKRSYKWEWLLDNVGIIKPVKCTIWHTVKKILFFGNQVLKSFQGPTVDTKRPVRKSDFDIRIKTIFFFFSPPKHEAMEKNTHTHSMICSEETHNAMQQSGNRKLWISFPELDDGTARDCDSPLRPQNITKSFCAIDISAQQV